MAKQPDIKRLLELQQLLLKFSHIERRVHRKQGNDFIAENDTEHSYNLAMTAWFLAQYFPHLDTDKLIRFGLIHDFVEIHAGDTYVFADQTHLDSKEQREKAALKQLEREWSDFPELTEQIAAYESRTSEEAKFIYALDKIMPIMLIYIHNGYTWQHEGISLEKLHSVKQSKVMASKEIDTYYNQLYELLLENQHLFGKPGQQM